MQRQAPPTHAPAEPTEDSLADRADAFATLANECRLAIVTELAPADLRAHPSPAGSAGEAPPVLAYSELKHRIGVRDAGRFNYHLRQLQPEFVESVDAGYRLTEAGLGAASVVATAAIKPAEGRTNRSADEVGSGLDSDVGAAGDRTRESTTHR